MLFDLGLSSLALEEPARGLSFQTEGPLDMRFGDDAPRTAADIVADATEEDLARLFREYGEEPRARAAARAIARARTQQPIRTTTGLARVLRAVFPPGRENPSLARVFQALRMAVNEELPELDAALEQSLDLRVAFLSYHSLEDRRVKHALRAWSGACVCPPGLPVCRCGARARANIVTRRPVRPSLEETSRNPRARSARLRVAEKRETISSTREVGERPPR
jgi:16S rRNA (cytosine1402-N4)-methyltransferase